jgi:hypothetical protein
MKSVRYSRSSPGLVDGGIGSAVSRLEQNMDFGNSGSRAERVRSCGRMARFNMDEGLGTLPSRATIRIDEGTT